MNKINILMITGFLILGVTSCTPESIYEELAEPQACCGNDLPIPPPPPPPPPNGAD